MKTLTTSIIAIALITFSGCSKKEDAVAETKQPHVSLQVAALQGNVVAIRQHIDFGSDLDVKDEYGTTPLVIATTFGKIEVARALIAGGASMEITNNEGATPLHVAAFFCRTEIIQALLDKGVDKTILNKSGATALQTVSSPFEEVKGIYDHFAKAFKPLGFRLDYERIKRTRPMVAEMLQ
jgi:ankyrin repeat protein